MSEELTVSLALREGDGVVEVETEDAGEVDASGESDEVDEGEMSDVSVAGTDGKDESVADTQALAENAVVNETVRLVEKEEVTEADGVEVIVNALADSTAVKETVRLLENEAVTDADGVDDTVREGVEVAKEADALAEEREDRVTFTSGEAESAIVADVEELAKGEVVSLAFGDGEVEGDAEEVGCIDTDGHWDVVAETAEEGETGAVMDGSSVSDRAMLTLEVNDRIADSDDECVTNGLSV